MWLADFMLELLFDYVHRQVLRWLVMAKNSDHEQSQTQEELAAAQKFDQHLLSLLSTDSKFCEKLLISKYWRSFNCCLLLLLLLGQSTSSNEDKANSDIIHIQISYLDSKQKRLCLIPLDINRSMSVAEVKQLLCSSHQG